MALSIAKQLKLLEDAGTVVVKPLGYRHKLPGEGAYFFQGNPLEILSNFMGRERNSGPDLTFDKPHDVAWCPATKTVLATAITDTGLPPDVEQPEIDLE